MTRIIAGRFGGIRLFSPRHHVRPTTDRVKEYLFNVCRDFDDAVVADLFSGTGALGLEAVSRGAVTVHAVEADRRSCDLISRNAGKCGDPEEFRLFTMKAENFIRKRDNQYDYILADPPYDLPMKESFFQNVHTALKTEGQFIFEYVSTWNNAGELPFSSVRERKFGETGVWIFDK